METEGTLLLKRSEIASLLGIEECIAAVGADSEDKQELDSSLLVSNKVVVDLLDQCVAIGELLTK